MTKFKLDDDTEYWAEDFVDGYLINPLFLPNVLTPRSPFIIRTEHGFSVHYLNPNTDEKFRCWGVFESLDDALNCIKNGSIFRNGHQC
jgi:hypothetical protein